MLYVVNLKLNDSISDQEVRVYSGPEYIEEEMEGLKFRINAKSFYQTNSRQAYELYKVARKFAGLDKPVDETAKPLVYDLYTGTGTIANFVAATPVRSSVSSMSRKPSKMQKSTRRSTDWTTLFSTQAI